MPRPLYLSLHAWFLFSLGSDLKHVHHHESALFGYSSHLSGHCVLSICTLSLTFHPTYQLDFRPSAPIQPPLAWRPFCIRTRPLTNTHSPVTPLNRDSDCTCMYTAIPKTLCSQHAPRFILKNTPVSAVLCRYSTSPHPGNATIPQIIHTFKEPTRIPAARRCPHICPHFGLAVEKVQFCSQTVKASNRDHRAKSRPRQIPRLRPS
jgi:hypothetical protein